MSGSSLVLLALAIPFAGALLIGLAGGRPNLCEAVSLVTASLLFLTVLLILVELRQGEELALALIEVLPGLPAAFRVEPLGMLFALVASGLWIVNSVYSIGYMRANNEAKQTRFYICFAIALGATIGVAFAGNMFTLFAFYELLSLSTYPLVAHHEDEEARQGGRTYLAVLMATSIGLLLLAMLLTWSEVGSLDFVPGGILQDRVSDFVGGLLLLLYMFGIGKAALMPVHRWLPAAMVAPTPVSA